MVMKPQSEAPSMGAQTPAVPEPAKKRRGGPKPGKEKAGYIPVLERWGKNKQWVRTKWVRPEEAHKYQDASIQRPESQQERSEFQPEHAERIHMHPGYEGPHRVGDIHPDDETGAEHRNELEKYTRTFFGERKNWVDKYGVTSGETRVKIGGQPVNAQKFAGSKGNAYLVDKGLNFIAYTPEGKFKFDKERDAIEKIKSFFVSKEVVLKNIDSFISNSTSDKPKLDATIVSEFQTGDNTVKLDCVGDEYKILVNGSEILSTDNIGKALSRYYRQISNLIEAGDEDKDVGLDLFGDKVVQVNRQALKNLSNLGKDKEASWVKNLDLSKLQLPYDDNMIEKYEPQSGIIHGLPTPNERNEGQDTKGQTLTRGDLSVKKKTDSGEIELEQKDTMAHSSPNIIKNPEEVKDMKPIERPVQVAKTAQTENHPPEQREIFANMVKDIKMLIKTDFPKNYEGEQAHESIGVKPNEDKIGTNSKPIISKSDDLMLKDVDANKLLAQVQDLEFDDWNKRHDEYNKVFRGLKKIGIQGYSPEFQNVLWQDERTHRSVFKRWKKDAINRIKNKMGSGNPAEGGQLPKGGSEGKFRYYLKPDQPAPKGFIVYQGKRGGRFILMEHKDVRGRGRPHVGSKVPHGKEAAVKPKEPDVLDRQAKEEIDKRAFGPKDGRDNKAVNYQDILEYKFGTRNERDAIFNNKICKVCGKDWAHHYNAECIYYKKEENDEEYISPDISDKDIQMYRDKLLENINQERIQPDLQEPDDFEQPKIDEAMVRENMEEEILHNETRYKHQLSKLNSLKVRVKMAAEDKNVNLDLDSVVRKLDHDIDYRKRRLEDIQQIIQTKVDEARALEYADDPYLRRKALLDKYPKMYGDVFKENESLIGSPITERRGRIGKGANNPDIVVVENQGKFVYKAKWDEFACQGYNIGKGTMWKREILTHQFYKVLGFDYVPTTVPRYDFKAEGSIQKWVSGGYINGKYDIEKMYKRGGKIAEQIEDITALEYITGSGDRYERNYLYDKTEDKIWMIDNGITWSENPYVRVNDFLSAMEGNDLPKRWNVKLAALLKSKDEINLLLSKYLNEREIGGFWNRVEKLSKSNKFIRRMR